MLRSDGLLRSQWSQHLTPFLVFLYSNVLTVLANFFASLSLLIAPSLNWVHITYIICKSCSDEFHETMISVNVTILFSLFTYFDFESVSSHYIASCYIYPIFFITLSYLKFKVYSAFTCMINIWHNPSTGMILLMITIHLNPFDYVWNMTIFSWKKFVVLSFF